METEIHKKVLCVKTFKHYYITVGKEYVATKISSSGRGDIATYYTVFNDINESYTYESGCFVDIQEERKKKLNNLNKKCPIQ